MTQKKKSEEVSRRLRVSVEESRLLHVWEEWPAEWLDPFRTPKQIEEARRRRRNIPVKGKGFVTRGDVCRKCGYTFRKWAVQCPICRTRVSTSVNEKKQLE